MRIAIQAFRRLIKRKYLSGSHLMMGIPPYVVEHLRGAMADYQTRHMSGPDNNVEKLTGRRSVTVGQFARAHLDNLNPKKISCSGPG
jgi:hypothetical protein